MSSSSIPTLSDVLYYTAGDSYDYLTDNRPIQQLSDNIKAVAASLLGIGYGEHSSISGALLATGSGVELQLNGNIAYPTNTLKTGIYGLVIGSTNGGLNKVIWRSNLLDLEVIALQSIITGAVKDQVLLITPSTGVITVANTVSTGDIVLGTVLTSPYITIGNPSSNSSLSLDSTPKENLLHHYGLTRQQNFNLFSALSATPIQFHKTVFSSALISQGTGRNINPLNISLTPSTGQVLIDTTTADSFSYSGALRIKKEKIRRLLVASSPVPDVSVVVSTGGTPGTPIDNLWSTISYPSSFPISNAENYDTYGVAPSILQDFYISRYYQYAKSNTITEPIVIITVFDPFASGAVTGGETNLTVVLDFITRPIDNSETERRRVVLVGSAATLLYSAFPPELTSL